MPEPPLYAPPAGADELARIEAAALACFEKNSEVPWHEFDLAMMECYARESVIIAVKLRLGIVHHSHGFYFRNQR